MYWLAGAIAAAALLYVAFRFFSRLAGEEERIRTFLRVYQSRRSKGASEKQAMEAVCELHILPGKARALASYGVSGNKYMTDVFEDREITLTRLVAHFIKLEFPDKYPMTIDLEAIRRRNRGGLPGPQELLEGRVVELMKELGVESSHAV